MIRAALLWACVVSALGGCEVLVDIPNVTLAGDAGANPDGGMGDGGACALTSDGAVRAGSTMVLVITATANYCIDVTEVTIEQFNAYVIATGGVMTNVPARCTDQDAGAGNEPAPVPPVDAKSDPTLAKAGLTECHAWAYCRWAGKRLCGTIDPPGGDTGGGANPDNHEWLNACVNGVFNLGDFYAASLESADGGTVCNIDHENPDGGIAPVESFAGCTGAHSPYDRLYDMVGNVSEFVNDFQGDGQGVSPLGGAWDVAASNIPTQGACYPGDGFNGVIFGSSDSGIRCCADLP